VALNLKQRLSRLNEKRHEIQEKRNAEREQKLALGTQLGILHWFGVRRTFGFLMLAGFIALRIWDPPTLQNLRLRNFDFYQVLKPRVSAANQRPVVIVDIDEASLRALGQWPWPRTLIAELVQKLQQAGTVVTAFDIMFFEPDRMSPASVAQSLPQIDEATREKMKTLTSNDEVLAAVMANSRVVLGQAAVITPTVQPPETSGLVFKGDPNPKLFTFEGLLRNIPVLENAAAGRGNLTLVPERDGVVRRVPVLVDAGGQRIPALTLDMLRVATGAGALIVVAEPGIGIQQVVIQQGPVIIPTDTSGRFWINFAPHDRARFVSAKDVIEGTFPADRFQGRVVIVGTSAAGLLDLKATPVEVDMPGVEVHAQILENIFTKSFLSRPWYSDLTEILTTAVVGFIFVVLAPIVGAMTMLGFGLFTAAAMAATAWYFFSQQGILFDLTFPLIAIFATFATLLFINYFREQADRRRIRGAFSQYISPTLVEQLANSPKKLVLGGEVRNMTILFSDVRGFTTISETFKNNPQGLTQLMNRLLTPLTNSIIERKGTIDKYIGDAIMAFWNAPLDDGDHEAHACAAALDMLRRIDDLNHEREAEALLDGVPFFPMNIGLGINTGTCVVGNMGSDLRFDYSVLGDPVNLASRLEGRSKEYGTPIIIGAKTAEKVNGNFAALQIDLITVKGKTEPESVYALLGDKEVSESQAFKTTAALMQEMLACYRNRDWTGAEQALERARLAPEHFSLDAVYDMYHERIHTFRSAPPPETWDGVYAFEKK